jgi:cysteine desulfurase family protein (TIGR01976 family)
MAFDRAASRAARLDFPALARLHDGRPLVFLDGPAGTQVPEAVIAAVARHYRTCNANTHGQFATSIECDTALWHARQAVADFLGADGPERISFGANMTTLTFALSRAIGRGLRAGDEVVITELDHEANRGPWLKLKERGVAVREVRLLPSGRLDADHLRECIGARTRLLAIGYSSNALGTVNDIALARELTRAAGAWLLVDAVHYAPHFPLDVRALDPDFLVCSAYKFYGPHVGILYSRAGLLEALDTDALSTQEATAPYRIETGTLNFAAIAGVRAAIDYLAAFGDGRNLRDRLLSAMSGISAYEFDLARHYYEAVRALPGVTVWGPDFTERARAPTVSITVRQHSAAAIAQALAQQGICVWDGDFYAARAIEVLGLKAAGGVLRTGMSLYSNEQDLERLLSALGALTRGQLAAAGRAAGLTSPGALGR